MHFSCHKMSHDISGKLSDILRISCIIHVTLIDSILHVVPAPPLEVFIDAAELLLEPLALLPFVLLFPFVHFLF